MFANKVAAQLALGADYPHPHSRVNVLKIENTPKPIVETLKVNYSLAFFSFLHV